MGRWGRCVLLIDVDIVFFRKKLKFFFQNFSVINMKVQLKYFYYCSIVIMVSRLGMGHWGQCVLLIDVDIQYENSFEVFLLLSYCYNGM